MNREELVCDSFLRETTVRLMRGQDLTGPEAEEFFHALLAARTNDAQIVAALVALAIKGETTEELVGMASAMRSRAVRVSSSHLRFVDTAGTGTSAAKSFNVSTAAAFVIAGAGLPVAKHGARAVTSRAGSADVLEALGVNTKASPENAERCLREHGICFLFAPLFHPAAARVARLRRQLGLRTVFNLLGPLVNPMRAPFQLLGVWSESSLKRIASALARLGTEKAWVVHGSDGLDEITLCGETKVAACCASGVESFSISPRDFGLEPRAFDALRGGGPEENADLIRALLTNGKSARLTSARDLVLMNAAAALHLAAMAPDLLSATALARESIASGRAAAKLEALIRETNCTP